MEMTSYQQELYNKAKALFLSSDTAGKEKLLSELRVKNGFYKDRLGTVELSNPLHREYVEVGELFLKEFSGTK